MEKPLSRVRQGLGFGRNRCLRGFLRFGGGGGGFGADDVDELAGNPDARGGRGLDFQPFAEFADGLDGGSEVEGVDDVVVDGGAGADIHAVGPDGVLRAEDVLGLDPAGDGGGRLDFDPFVAELARGKAVVVVGLPEEVAGGIGGGAEVDVVRGDAYGRGLGACGRGGEGRHQQERLPRAGRESDGWMRNHARENRKPRAVCPQRRCGKGAAGQCGIAAAGGMDGETPKNLKKGT